MKRAAAVLMTLALVLTLAPTTALAAYSEAYGQEVWLQNTQLQDGAVLSDNIYWSSYYQQLRHEYYITYSPGEDVIPAVSYGEAVCDRLTVSAAAAAREAEGYRVVGGVNGDFYSTTDGWPLGVLISQGELLSSSGDYYAVGFREDGTVVMGKPAVGVTAWMGGVAVPLAAVNKPRVEQGGITLLTYDFRSDHTTGATTAGVSVLATIVDGKAALGGALTLQVEQITEGAGAVAMEESQVVLTCAATGNAERLAQLRSLFPGDEITVEFLAGDPAWNEVKEALGAMYLLVENGQVQSGFEAGYAPRTAAGVTASGELILYTVDGRQTGYSMGASLKVLAQRMAELGCVTAVCLDGGGSTTAVASTPDSAVSRLINSPSDQAERKVTNHLLLLADGERTERESHIYLTADAPVVLAGHTVALNANVVDTSYFPMDGEVSLWATDGEIVDDVFIAPQQSGWVTITAVADRMETSLELLVIDTPDEMTIRWGETPVTSLTLVPGDKAELNVSAAYGHLPLEVEPADLIWTLDPALGYVDDQGVLHTAYTEGAGMLTVTKGQMALEIPVTLDADSPFADTEGHWGGAYMAALYHRGVLTGETRDDGLYALPDRGVTRAEFAVLMLRYLGLDGEDYAAVEVPFADMDKVDAWAANAVRAAYTLGLITGAAAGDQLIFDPQGTLTRAQAMTILGRLEMEPVAPADLSQFVDAGEIPSYAVPYFETMVSLGVVGGSYGKLNPNATMTRAEISKVLATMP